MPRLCRRVGPAMIRIRSRQKVTEESLSGQAEGNEEWEAVVALGWPGRLWAWETRAAGGCATFLGETSAANGGHGTAGLITATEGVFAGFDS
jgi:hypothetical protein